MSDTLKLEYKVGAIEFRAEGSAEAVEQQRVNFMNVVLPAAVEAMVRTQTNAVQERYIETPPQAPMLEANTQAEVSAAGPTSENDFSRKSLSSFLKQYGALSEQDFTLFAAYFDEVKNDNKAFSIDDVKRYYSEARRPLPKNPSMSIHRLAEKGYIMDTSAPDEAKQGKYYMLTEDGLSFIREYVPKENTGEIKTRSRQRKTATKAPSSYDTINADDLNIGNYPAVKSLSGSKEQVIMAMYIVTNEGKGEWFTIDDVVYLLINVFEVHANYSIVNGIFTRNKSMFAAEKDPENKKLIRRKLLSGAKDFAASIINNVNTAE